MKPLSFIYWRESSSKGIQNMKCTWTFSITTKFEMSPSCIALQKFTRFLNNSKPPMIPEDNMVNKWFIKKKFDNLTHRTWAWQRNHILINCFSFDTCLYIGPGLWTIVAKTLYPKVWFSCFPKFFIVYNHENNLWYV